MSTSSKVNSMINDLIDSTDSGELLEQLHKHTKDIPGAKALDGTTHAYEVGYLAAALASANRKNQDLQQQLDMLELESSPLEQVKSQLDYIEDRIQGVYDKVV